MDIAAVCDRAVNQTCCRLERADSRCVIGSREIGGNLEARPVVRCCLENVMARWRVR